MSDDKKKQQQDTFSTSTNLSMGHVKAKKEPSMKFLENLLRDQIL